MPASWWPPDPHADTGGLAQARDGLVRALHDDYVQMYAIAVRDEAKPVVRPNTVMSLVLQPNE